MLFREEGFVSLCDNRGGGCLGVIMLLIYWGKTIVHGLPKWFAFLGGGSANNSLNEKNTNNDITSGLKSEGDVVDRGCSRESY